MQTAVLMKSSHEKNVRVRTSDANRRTCVMPCIDRKKMKCVEANQINSTIN